MCKSIKKCFYKKLTFKNLLAAHYRACKGKGLRKEVILFEMDLETNLIRILNEIKSGNYKFGKYREFIIYEPKERLIKSLPYKDRIVHQWYVEEFIKPYYHKRFISDSYACIENKGNHKAVLNMQRKMKKKFKENKDYYVLKCDIKKYFYNIDKGILLNLLSNKIKDKKVIEFTKIILDDGSNIGIPIGNYTSQYFANIYLNELDQYIKNVLRIKYYERFMDDFILLLNDKNEATKILEKIRHFLIEQLHLELNSKCKYYHNKFGVNFSGYVIYKDFILLRKRFKNNFRKNIRLWIKLNRINHLDENRMKMSYNSFCAHAMHANSFNYMKNINNVMNKKVKVSD